MALRPPAERGHDQLAVGLAGARLRCSTGLVPGRGGGVTRARVGGRCRRRGGGHLRRNGRVCRSSARTAPTPHHHACGLQVAAGRLAPDPGRPLDPPQRPAEASQGEDLLSFVFSQDVAHAGQEHVVPDRRQRLGALSGMAAFQVSNNGRFWVSTEAGQLPPHPPRWRRTTKRSETGHGLKGARPPRSRVRGPRRPMEGSGAQGSPDGEPASGQHRPEGQRGRRTCTRTFPRSPSASPDHDLVTRDSWTSSAP